MCTLPSYSSLQASYILSPASYNLPRIRTMYSTRPSVTRSTASPAAAATAATLRRSPRLAAKRLGSVHSATSAEKRPTTIVRIPELVASITLPLTADELASLQHYHRAIYIIRDVVDTSCRVTRSDLIWRRAELDKAVEALWALTEKLSTTYTSSPLLHALRIALSAANNWRCIMNSCKDHTAMTQYDRALCDVMRCVQHITDAHVATKRA